MSTKAVDGKMPFEAAFRKKPDLRDVREWGENVWVHTEDGDKLGGCVHKGQWMGIDEQFKGVHIYWPDKRSVTIERNIYFDKSTMSASHLEGEIDGIVETKANAPAKPPETPSTLKSSPPANFPAPATSPHILAPPPAPVITPVEPPADKRT